MLNLARSKSGLEDVAKSWLIASTVAHLQLNLNIRKFPLLFILISLIIFWRQMSGSYHGTIKSGQPDGGRDDKPREKSTKSVVNHH